MQELDSPLASNGAGYLFPLETAKNIKFNRLVFSSKRLQNPSKRPQKPANAYKSGKVCQMVFAVFVGMPSFHHEELVSQLKFDQTLEIQIQKTYYC